MLVSWISSSYSQIETLMRCDSPQTKAPTRSVTELEINRNAQLNQHIVAISGNGSLHRIALMFHIFLAQISERRDNDVNQKPKFTVQLVRSSDPCRTLCFMWLFGMCMIYKQYVVSKYTWLLGTVTYCKCSILNGLLCNNCQKEAYVCNVCICVVRRTLQ